MTGYHIGRSWSGTAIEDTCPCPKAPCGLVYSSATDPRCLEHARDRGKSMRQAHQVEACPAAP